MRLRTFLPALLILSLTATGCATKKYVRGEVGASETRVGDELGREIEKVQDQTTANQRRIDEHDQQITSASKTAQEALERAMAAGKLAEGKFLYETVLTDDKVRFGFDKATLSDEARAALDEFATDLKSRNQSVYIEIQGHTDSTGPEEYNYELGLERAEAVRRYLSREHGLALHRINVISYGESEPAADNTTRQGRAQNRRVVLVVLQ